MTGHIPSAPGAVATPRASAPRGAIAAWGLWDWAFSAFNAVATTFVFNTYLSGKAFGNPAHESELLGVFTAVAGVIIAVVAPVAGQRSARPPGCSRPATRTAPCWPWGPRTARSLSSCTGPCRPAAVTTARPQTPAILEEAARRLGAAAYEEAWQAGRGLHLADIAGTVPVPAR